MLLMINKELLLTSFQRVLMTSHFNNNVQFLSNNGVIFLCDIKHIKVYNQIMGISQETYTFFDTIAAADGVKETIAATKLVLI